MSDTLKGQRLRRVLDEYPWLREAFDTADRTLLDDGQIRITFPLDSLQGRLAGLMALTDALGCSLEEVLPGEEPSGENATYLDWRESDGTRRETRRCGPPHSV